MVVPGEIAGVSVGYVVRAWEITDSERKIIDPESNRFSIADDLIFHGN
jgi:hypothetical protein